MQINGHDFTSLRQSTKFTCEGKSGNRCAKIANASNLSLPWFFFKMADKPVNVVCKEYLSADDKLGMLDS